MRPVSRPIDQFIKKSQSRRKRKTRQQGPWSATGYRRRINAPDYRLFSYLSTIPPGLPSRCKSTGITTTTPPPEQGGLNRRNGLSCVCPRFVSRVHWFNRRECGRLLDASLTGDDSIAAARHNTSPPYTHEIARSDSTEITQMLINPMGEIFI